MRYRRPRRAAGCSKAGRRSAREAQALPRGDRSGRRGGLRPAAPPQDAQRGRRGDWRRVLLTCARASRRLIRCGAFVGGTAFRRRASRRLSLTGILGTGRGRNLPFRTELRLQFGQLIIFELHEPLQFFQLSLQIIQPIFQLVILTPAGIEAFLSYRKLVTKSATIGRAGFGSCRRLPGVSSHKTEVVSGVATGGRSTGLGATGRIQLTSTCYSASSALTPGSVLLGDLGDRFSLRTAGYLLCIRQTALARSSFD